MPDDSRSISWNIASLIILVYDVINFLNADANSLLWILPFGKVPYTNSSHLLILKTLPCASRNTCIVLFSTCIALILYCRRRNLGTTYYWLIYLKNWFWCRMLRYALNVEFKFSSTISAVMVLKVMHWWVIYFPCPLTKIQSWTEQAIPIW